MLKNQSIFIKQAIQAGIILLFLIITGIIGFVGIRTISKKLDITGNTSSQSNAAKEMGNAVSQDFISAMTLIHADSEKVLNRTWNGHLEHVKKFDAESNQLLKSLDKTGVRSGAASQQQMRKLVQQADEYHNRALQQGFQKIHDMTLAEIRLRQQLHASMKQIETAYGQLIDLAENLEAGIKSHIKSRIEQGASAATILGRENTWADMSMEIKSTLANSRIAVEEYMQGMEDQAAEKLEAAYAAREKEFDGWITALLDGAQTSEGKVAAVRVDDLRRLVLDMQALSRDGYRTQVAGLMKMQRELIKTRQAKLDTVSQAEKTAGQMTDLLHKIEQLAAANMRQAEEEARAAAVNANILMVVAILLSILFSIVFIVIISRGITRPLQKTVDFAETMAQGDFSKVLEIKQQDEVGKLAESLNRMVANLSRMIRKTHSGITTLSATSSELSSLSEVMATGAENTADKSNTVASASEEMNANVESVAAAMEEATINVNNISAAVEEMNANFGEVTERIRQTSKNVQQAAKASEESSHVVAELERAAFEIGTIAETINSIADKTSLLALNATIEAARAGEAGKGFAVVAGEIKNLAQQVSASTGDIGKKLKAIQDSTQSTISGINQISGAIAEVNESMESINIAMEQQNQATQEISQNIAQTSSGLKEVNENISQTSLAVAQVTLEIGDVNKSAHDISTSSSEVQENAENLMALSRQLGDQMAAFKTAETGFSAGPAKLAHAAWKKKLADLLSGKHDLQVSQISSHKECEFGQWYFGPGMQRFSSNATFQGIDEKHKRVHDLAREITETYHKGEIERATTMFQEFTKTTGDLFGRFDQLESEA